MKYLVSLLWIAVFVCSCGQGESAETKYMQKLELQDVKLENLRILSKLQHYGEGKTIKNVYLHLGKGDSIPLKQIIGEEEKVVFYFSQYGCSSCYQPFWDKVLEQKDKWGKDILILAFFENGKDFKMFMNERSDGIPVYRINEGLQLFSDYDDYSYVFRTSSSLVVDNLFVLSHSNVEYMDDYLSVVSPKSKGNNQEY